MNEEQNFFDARTIVAVIVVGATFVGWQWYMQKKYPDAMAKKAAAQNQTVEPAKIDGPKVGATEAKVEIPTTPAPGAPVSEKIFGFETETLNFEISSNGMGLKSIKVRKYKDRKGEFIEFGHPEQNIAALETRLLGRNEPLPFAVEKISDRVFVGRASVGKLQITKQMEVDPDKYLIDYKISVTGEDPAFIGLSTYLTEEVLPVAGHNLLLPQFEKQEFYVETADTHERVAFAKDDQQKAWNRVKIASIGSQYFTQAVLDKSTVLPEVKARVEHAGRLAEINLQYSQLNKGEPFQLNYQAYVGPKSHELLMKIDENLAKVVDFGFFNWIARHILALLKWFYGLIGNWGLAIIALTVLVRLMVLPVNIYSFKSMKAMQAIQPQLKDLRERYKDDQQKQQQEIMTLMKQHKVNPLGGCLPIFLQFPIFIALYQVLGNSIELYQAPFGLWIHDLSLKDPFYILPVLMGVTMFIQQKITPNTMDPAQAKVMLMMPIVFTFFMVSLPSGLTLYMWVGALFSVLQQMYFMRDGSKNQVAVPRGK